MGTIGNDLLFLVIGIFAGAILSGLLAGKARASLKSLHEKIDNLPAAVAARIAGIKLR